jgi:hypothetical protein
VDQLAAAGYGEYPAHLDFMDLVAAGTASTTMPSAAWTSA